MKLPSLNKIVEDSSAALRRFPLVLLSAAVAVATMICIVELDLDQSQHAARLYSLFMVSLLGISFFLALNLTGEKRSWNATGRTAARVAGVAVLAFYYWMLPDDFDAVPDEFLFRYMLYFLAAHLLVAVAPFWRQGEVTGFWHYNKTLFLRFLTAVLFSGVLFVGLTIAMVSVDELLGVDIEGERYLQLFLVISGLFNTWFFLSGIPAPVGGPDMQREYPRGLKLFTQYILIPLVVIYVIILYLYTGKVIVEWTWPEGLVAYLVLSFSIAGIFALLLLHPIQEKAENRWIKTFSRNYFRLLVPLVILLLLAIWRRIWEYSFTVNRYFVLVLGLWLGGIVIYFIFSRSRNIKVIPASLALLAILISFGPWGAFSVSERSQANRLEQYLQKHEILRDGMIHQATGTVSHDDRAEISSIIRYLNSTHSLDRLQPWFEEDLSALAEDSLNVRYRTNRREIPRILVSKMGLEYVNEWGETAEAVSERHFFSEPREVFSLDGYTWLVRHRYMNFDEPRTERPVGPSTLLIQTEPDRNRVVLLADSVPGDTLSLDFGPLAEKLASRYADDMAYGIPSGEMTLEGSNEQFRVRFHLSDFLVRREEDGTVLLGYEGTLLLRFNE